MPTQLQRDLAAEFLEIGAIKFGQFRLKLHEKNPDAPLSPVYIDLRLIRSFPRAFQLTIAAYEELTRTIECELYADIPTAATPLVGALAYKHARPMISPRLDQKTHGTRQKIEGAFRGGQVALVIDDLITRADSKFEAITALENAGLLVRDVVVLVDREQGGVAERRKRGYACHSALSLSSLLEFYRQAGLIATDDYSRTVAYLAASAAGSN